MSPNDIANRLIAYLPASSRQRLVPQLSTVSLTFRQFLSRTGEPIETVYFPLSGWVSTIVQMAEGRSAEVATIGREGVVLPSGNGVSPYDHMVQGDGHALSLNKVAFDHELEENQPLRLLLNRYQALVHAQTALTVGCNGWHDLEQRFARWLLAAHDRADSDDLPLTQELLAMMLCVHRPRVTVIARSLQVAGIINYNRGHIIVRDRAALEATACECYQTMRDLLEQVFQ